MDLLCHEKEQIGIDLKMKDIGKYYQIQKY